MIEITKWEPAEKGSRKCLVSLRIEKWGGFVIHEVAVFLKDGKRWIGFPSRKVQVNGNERWLPFVTFDKPEILRKFSDEVLKLLDNPVIMAKLHDDYTARTMQEMKQE